MTGESIDKTGDCPGRPRNRTCDGHAVPLIETASKHVLFPDSEVKVAAGWLHDFVNELPEDPAACTVELVTVENLVKHNRASGHRHITNASPFSVSLVGNNDSVLIDTLVRRDATLECVLPNVREHIAMRLEVPVDRLEVTETRVSHHFLRNTKIGSNFHV